MLPEKVLRNFLIVFAALLVFLTPAHSQSEIGEFEETCLLYSKNPEAQSPSRDLGRIQQGRPGKLGPRGFPGPRNTWRVFVWPNERSAADEQNYTRIAR